jgi:hypothetical protein
MKRARASAIALAIVVASQAVHASSAAAGVQHQITCRWNGANSVVYRATGTAVQGRVQVVCSDNLDDANTQAQLQINEAGVWRDYGNPVVSYSTSTYITVVDGAGGKDGCHSYRVEGTHFGQHGNIFSLPTFYSSSAMICF